MSNLPETETKSEFAARCGVDPSAVSHWIRDGKIGPEALDGIGRRARIRVAVAQTQLRTRLDIGQRLGNGLGTRLAAPQVDPTPAPTLWTVPGTEFVPTVPADQVEERIKLERLAALERENRRKAEEEAERVGRYVDKAAAQRQMGRIAKAMLDVFEGGLPLFATTVAERWGMPQRDVLHLLTDVNRTVRTRAAEALRRQAETLPRLIEDESEAPTAG